MIMFTLYLAEVLQCQLTETTVRGSTYCLTRKHYPDSEPTSLCSFSLMPRAYRRSNTYQFYSLWFDPNGVRTNDRPHSMRARQPLPHRCGSTPLKNNDITQQKAMKRGKKDLNRLIWSQQNGTFYLDMHIYVYLILFGIKLQRGCVVAIFLTFGYRFLPLEFLSTK